MVVNLEDFTKYMEHIKAQYDKDDILSDLLVCEDSGGWISTACDILDDLIDLLSANLTENKEEAKDWISWWLWEIDMDAPEEKRCNNVWIKNKEDGLDYKYTILDLDDLYYLIIGEENKIKTKVQESAPKLEQFNTFSTKKEGVSLYDIFTEEILKEMEDAE